MKSDAGHGSLLRKRTRLADKLAALDARIADLGIRASGGGGGMTASGTRYRNEMTLPDALAAAMKGKTMSVGDAMGAVMKAGYRSASKTFRIQVNGTLLKDKRFKRVERGMYSVR